MARTTSYKPEYAEQAEKLCLLGATDDNLADFFKVSERTIHRWKIQHDDFSQALKVGKEQADDMVERSLFQRAMGYEYDGEKIFMPSGAEAPVRAETRIKVLPDVTAQIFWLKNRRSQIWRDRHELEHTAGGDLAAVLLAARERAAQ